MLSEKDIVRLRHMLDAARKAIEFSSGRQREDLDQNEMYALAVVRLIEIIGEAARALSEDTRAMSAVIPWREIVGTRERLAHGYFDVDHDIVWSIITSHLPGLVTELEKLLGSP